MTNIFNVSDYFLAQIPMTHKKLQKMCYYAYAWYYTLYNRRLFDNGRFEAWVHGPVNRELYLKYKGCGWQEISNPTMPDIDHEIKDFLDTILTSFGDFSADELESMTHAEKPWQVARTGYQPSESCEVHLSDGLIKEYYTSLMEENQCE